MNTNFYSHWFDPTGNRTRVYRFSSRRFSSRRSIHSTTDRIDFCLPPSGIKREKIFAEFEVLIGQLFHHASKSKESHSALKAKLTDLAHSFCGTPIDITNFTTHRECFQAVKSLHNNSDIIIMKADKSNAVVILDKFD